MAFHVLIQRTFPGKAEMSQTNTMSGKKPTLSV